MWDPPGSGKEPVSLTRAGGFFTTEPPGKLKAEPFPFYQRTIFCVPREHEPHFGNTDLMFKQVCLNFTVITAEMIPQRYLHHLFSLPSSPSYSHHLDTGNKRARKEKQLGRNVPLPTLKQPLSL